jgi:hypothetical protein
VVFPDAGSPHITRTLGDSTTEIIGYPPVSGSRSFSDPLVSEDARGDPGAMGGEKEKEALTPIG